METMLNHLRAVAIFRFVIASLETTGALLLLILGAATWEPHSLMHVLSTFIFIVALCFGAHGAFGLVMAYGLLERRPWGRPLGIIVSLLELPGFPIGTITGGYTLWVLLQPETVQLFAEPAPAPAPKPLPARVPHAYKWE